MRNAAADTGAGGVSVVRPLSMQALMSRQDFLELLEGDFDNALGLRLVFRELAWRIQAPKLIEEQDLGALCE
jgi:hypothetical protein